MKEEEPMPAPALTVGMAEVQPDVSIDVVRSGMAANFEQDNLDVPAFLRKRGEIM